MNEVQCKKLYSLEHWQGNDLVSSCCAFYVLFTNGDCLKASYNDESCIWEVTGVKQNPNFSSLDGDDDFSYRYVEYGHSDDQAIGKLKSYEVIGNNYLCIRFSSGLEVSLVYDPKTEKESITTYVY